MFRLLSLNSAEQEREMHLHGYAQLTQQQLQIAYGPGGLSLENNGFISQCNDHYIIQKHIETSWLSVYKHINIRIPTEPHKPFWLNKSSLLIVLVT
jgi:putative AlgH/UPF0301 family transcriptional regulator